MENRKIPALIGLAGIVIALVVFFFVAGDDTAEEDTETSAQQTQTQTEPETNTGGGDDKPDKPERLEKPEEPEVPEIEIEGGEVVGGAEEIEVRPGEAFTVSVTTDAPDELHLHGYELYFDIVPGKSNRIDVPSTDIGEGVVELESHTTGVVLAEISVVPN